MVDLMALLLQALDSADELMRQGLASEQRMHAKGERDFALDVDLQVERQIKQILAVSDIPVLGEELAWQGRQAERFWVVDPVDGTVNYARGLPLCGCCIALVENGNAVLAGISLPMLNERYLAEKGRGAQLNGRALQVTASDDLSQAMVVLGDFAVGEGSEQRNRQRFALVPQLVPKVMRLRVLGSAALQLAWLAAGRVDISLILSNKPWDVQAGVLIAREAGALVFDADGSEHSTESKYTLAAVPGLKSALYRLWLSVDEQAQVLA